MIFIIAEYDDSGIKVPKIVGLKEAQQFYDNNFSEKLDLATIDKPMAFVASNDILRDKLWDDVLWIAEKEMNF